MKWSLSKKIAFRFWAVYVLFFTLYCQFVASWLVNPVLESFIPWFGKQCLGISRHISTAPNGSGDKLYDYLLLLVSFIFTLLITVIWSILDRKRDNYRNLLKWLVVLIRYYVIYQMLLYGVSKAFYLQMRPPEITALQAELGEMTPMGLVWTFIGLSKGYCMITGWLEILGGALLLFRRTQTLGAMVVFGVMLNVALLNYFYHIPVKILSTHLVIFAVFLLGLDARRLVNLFILNKPTEVRSISPYFQKKWLNLSKNWAKWISVVLVSCMFVQKGVSISQVLHERQRNDLLPGNYEVSVFMPKGSKNAPVKLEDWSSFEIRGNGTVRIQRVDKTFDTFQLNLEPEEGEFELMDLESKEMAASGILNLATTKKFKLWLYESQDTFYMEVYRPSFENYRLTQIGFSWIIERPDGLR